jgi:2'-5' RNA ligase
LPAAAPKPLRLFLALRVPEAVREELRRFQAELRARLPGDAVRWTRPDQIHLTLQFLGNVAANQVEPLIAATRRACQPFAPMHLRAERIGFFPHVNAPRVVWTWVHDDFGDLPRLQKAVAEAAAPFCDHREEKSFTGHLTLGRIGRLPPAQARIPAELAVALTDRVYGDWTAGHVALMRSELSATGSQYTSLVEIPLPRTESAPVQPSVL